MIKKGFLIGLLLFGIFFGAGNLIFPAELGFRAGGNFSPAMFGFVLSGVGIAIITLVVGTMVNGGYKRELSIKVSPIFSKAYLTILYLAIGPFFAIPRTAGTSFSIGLAPVTGNGRFPLFIFSAVYFLFAYIIAINPSKLMDRVGKVLTPMFAMLIIILIIVGNLNFHTVNVGEMSGSMEALKKGFFEGYNTLDALASVSFCLIATSSIKTFGFSSKKEYIKIMAIVGIVTAIFFSSLYIGLGALGNKFSIPADVLKDSNTNIGTYILSKSSYELFGNFGQIFLGAMTILTCFTTTAGLIVAVSEFFAETFPKFGYKVYVNVFTIIGFAMSNFGLNNIIKISIPVLMILYPITIVVVAIVILNKLIKLSKKGMRLTIIMTTAASTIEVLVSTLNLKTVKSLISVFIGGNSGFLWVNFVVLGIVLSLLLRDKIKGESFEIKNQPL
ncbi:branched-chain amino acid transport system II carrier protein [Lachnoanaerobaculum sp. Marseille-Q4761]|jgi:branched-chain amino acid transport system II carrier protein|uniref:branched-chain amino acid transport system II carrier protein n=1 Tax=Lachnoanaerobaculum sp. Marseille-Q4761 TaxID=2819511 RepID=UPI001AA18771|nr:branched-chain amino acid transport system II carrier protein [Lachnoanaerobaculum sp. Marseille-Q4761]MBO1872091.1 branched-chain amino acid transport system II carrier protein [Lachnoanaerobaculum sp. Marseille-Q4761]